MRDMSLYTVNISFPRNMLRAVDELAREEFRSRSELLREAIRLYMERKKRLNREFSFWRSEAKAKKIKPFDIEKAKTRVRATLKKAR